MSYENTRARRAVSRYLKYLEGERGLTRGYVVQSKSTLLQFLRHCRELSISSERTISSEAVLSYLKKYEGLSASCQRLKATVLRQFLAWSANPCMLNLKVRISGTARTRVSWYSDEEVEQVWQTSMNPEQRVLIGGGLLMALRRIEILRLRVADVKSALRSDVLVVRGKFNKVRELPLQDDYRSILKEYLAYSNPKDDQEQLLGMARTKSETLLADVGKRAGVTMKFHSNRRTCCRRLHQRGVSLELLAEILGHESISETRKYIGLNLSDMKQALARQSLAREGTLESLPVNMRA